MQYAHIWGSWTIANRAVEAQYDVAKGYTIQDTEPSSKLWSL